MSSGGRVHRDSMLDGFETVVQFGVELTHPFGKVYCTRRGTSKLTHYGPCWRTTCVHRSLLLFVVLESSLLMS